MKTLNKTPLLLAVSLTTLLVAGCNIEKDRAKMKATGELRHNLFVECMNLAAKMPRKGDDDVSDIVDECDSTAYYMANHISN